VSPIKAPALIILEEYRAEGRSRFSSSVVLPRMSIAASTPKGGSSINESVSSGLPLPEYRLLPPHRNGEVAPYSRGSTHCSSLVLMAHSGVFRSTRRKIPRPRHLPRGIYAASLIGSMSEASSLSAFELLTRFDTAHRCK
jgi:hypothetical protein